MVITKPQVNQIILQNLGWIPNLGTKLHIVDNAYETVSKSFILQQIKTDEWLQTELTYKSEVFDCDDFAIHLKSKLAKLAFHKNRLQPAALGFMLTTIHAYNFSIGPDRRLILYDTVNGQVEEQQSNFKNFLDFNPGNTVKLLYL